jgi:hypothetical protein
LICESLNIFIPRLITSLDIDEALPKIEKGGRAKGDPSYTPGRVWYGLKPSNIFWSSHQNLSREGSKNFKLLKHGHVFDKLQILDLN